MKAAEVIIITSTLIIVVMEGLFALNVRHPRHRVVSTITIITILAVVAIIV